MPYKVAFSCLGANENVKLKVFLQNINSHRETK